MYIVQIIKTNFLFSIGTYPAKPEETIVAVDLSYNAFVFPIMKVGIVRVLWECVFRKSAVKVLSKPYFTPIIVVYFSAYAKMIFNPRAQTGSILIRFICKLKPPKTQCFRGFGVPGAIRTRGVPLRRKTQNWQMGSRAFLKSLDNTWKSAYFREILAVFYVRPGPLLTYYSDRNVLLNVLLFCFPRRSPISLHR